MATFGFAGSIDAKAYARMQALRGPRVCVESPSAWLPTVTAADRTVSFAAGAGYILGLRDERAGAFTVQQVANATGAVRIDLIVMRANWATSTVTPTAITGSSSTVPPAINKTVLTTGDIYDFPLCVCLTPNGGGAYAAGDIRDIRVYGGVGGLTLPQDNYITAHDLVPGQEWRIEGTGVRYIVNSTGAPIPIGPSVRDQQYTIGTSASTSYTATLTGGTTCSTLFVAPPSGRVRVGLSCRSFTGATGFIYMSFEIRSGAVVGSGTVHTAAADERAVMHQTTIQSLGFGRDLHVSGLTPGSTYNVRTMFRVSTNTGTWADKELSVEPLA